MAINNGFRLVVHDQAGYIVANKALPVNKSISEEYIYACAFDRYHRLWFSTGDQLFVTSLQSSQYVPVKDMAGDKSQAERLDFISYICFDAQDNMWLACRKGIAYAPLREPVFSPYFESAEKNIKLTHVNYVYSDNDTLLYACTTTGLFTVNRITRAITSMGLAAGSNYLFRNFDHRLIVSSEAGLLAYNDHRFLPIDQLYPELAPIQKEMINSCLFLGDSLVVMGSETNKGIFIWDLRNHTMQGHEAVTTLFSNTIINTVYKDALNKVWILSDNAISLWHPLLQKVEPLSLMDLDLKIPLNLLMDICELKGSYWLSVYGKGVAQLDSTGRIVHIYSTADGLLNTGVYKLLPYKDSLLFITSNNGLFTLNPATRSLHQYLVEDGLNSNHFEENCGSAGNNVFYAGGVEGFSRIVPALLHNNTIAPTLYITNLKTERASGKQDSFLLQQKEFYVSNDVLQTTVSFTAFNYSNPKRVRYAYRIEGLTNDWIETGNRNFITFVGQKPGHYVLEVRAANEDGVWSVPQKISLVFQPQWYQTWTFKILLFLCLLTILYLIYRNRIAQLRKQQQIRKDIANDLHDDIGSTLNSVKIFTHLAKREPDSKEHLNNIETSITEATLGLRDMIWVLDDSRDTVDELMERIRKFAQPVCLAHQIAFSATIETYITHHTLTKTEKRNYLLMAKEGVTNSLKYARCGHIQVRLCYLNSRLCLQVKDDGCGFNMSAVSEGNGLKNLSYRARQIHATCEIFSTSCGTTINIVKR